MNAYAYHQNKMKLLKSQIISLQAYRKHLTKLKIHLVTMSQIHDCDNVSLFNSRIFPTLVIGNRVKSSIQLGKSAILQMLPKFQQLVRSQRMELEWNSQFQQKSERIPSSFTNQVKIYKMGQTQSMIYLRIKIIQSRYFRTKFTKGTSSIDLISLQQQFDQSIYKLQANNKYIIIEY
ncbi:unnamed protein product [Paramecium primaurelia]|uniref:Uncharacterized protein n=1 Tax=Paramecium primaurelia TaxID=5886 RepID=A0A8S1QHU2_PARPR|nr:unnamed protein product [Paramecium primaurelia]